VMREQPDQGRSSIAAMCRTCSREFGFMKATSLR
jgi:hypothetical protein